MACMPLAAEPGVAVGPNGGAANGATGSYLLPPDPRIAALTSPGRGLDLPDLEALALAASGLDATAAKTYTARLDAILDSLAASVGPADPSGAKSEASRAEAALGFLHDGTFKSYRSTASTLDLVLDKGSYNCVSSAVLYLLAMRRLGIPASGVRTEDHAFCLVHVDGHDVDVETTNAYGFDPGIKQEFQSAFGHATGYRYVPPGNYARRQAIDARKLISLIMSNRIALLEDQGDYEGALAIAPSCALLDGSPEGRGILADCVNNMTVSLGQKGDWLAAARLADEGAASLPENADLPRLAALCRGNFAVVAHNRFAGLFNARDYAAAKRAIEEALAFLPGDAGLRADLEAAKKALAR
jgi:tetratricopeptide (TPR) repeat protein